MNPAPLNQRLWMIIPMVDHKTSESELIHRVKKKANRGVSLVF
jgi:hypothetical protein